MTTRNFSSAILFCLLVAACGPGGSGPSLSPISDQVVGVNQEIVIILNGTDPDGDDLVYRFRSEVPEIQNRARITKLPIGAGEFRWTPMASDVGVWPFDFVVSDGSFESTITVMVDVRSAVGSNSAPVFLQPLGTGATLNLENDSCLELDIVIQDEDSASVDISQEAPRIEGASIQVSGGLTAVWRWCPSSEQVAQEDRYTLTLGAKDDDHPQTRKAFLIVLRRPLKPDCPGGAPQINHLPSDQSTLLGVTLSASISDDIGLKREPLLYYSNTEPATPVDLSSMTQLTMSLASGSMQDGTWEALVPNPVADQPTGAQADIYYVIVADDNDDAEGECDHVTQAPGTGSFSMQVTNPGGSGGAELCTACTNDLQCGGASDLCVRVGQNNDPFCLQGCSSDSDCPADYSCSATAVDSINGDSGRQCIPDSSDCSNPGGEVCDDDDFENNDSLSEALSRAPLSPGTEFLTSCPANAGTGDDEDWFEIDVGSEGTVTLTLVGGTDSDLDMQLLNEAGQVLDSSMSFESLEEISKCLDAGTYVVRVFAWGDAANDYTLEYNFAGGSCGGNSCSPDDFEPDNDAENARFVDGAPGVAEAWEGNTICTGDRDWYDLLLFPGDTLTATLSFTQNLATEDLDIHLLDSNSVDLTPCSLAQPLSCDTGNGQSGTSNETFTWTATETAIYYLVVEGWNGSENSYDITLLLTEP